MSVKALLLVALYMLVQCTITTTAGADPVHKDPDQLTVFILPHSHDDVGWVQTVDEYYQNFVHDIYSSVIKEMIDHPDRRFQSVEQAYFYMWWQDATAQQKQDAHTLVKRGQLEFVVGGWVMPDEATTDYASLIETMTIGHEFIYDTFGVVPRYGFQCDPFGASSVFAAYSALMGFNGHIIDRINYYDKAHMQATQTMEFLWKPSASLGQESHMFTHVLDQYKYGVPFLPVELQLEYLCLPHQKDCPGGNFLWDGDDGHPAIFWAKNPPYPGVNASNVQFYSDFLVNNTRQRSQWFRTQNLLWPFGLDFQWFNATRMYNSMDKIIAHVNARNQPGGRYQGIILKYATMSEYFGALHATNTTWGERDTQDFLPYTSTDKPSRTWSGYYTSHSQLKGYARSRAALLRATEQLYSLAATRGKSWTSEDWGRLQALRQAVAILQHHDAVTGTEGPGENQAATPAQIGGIVANYNWYLRTGTETAHEVAGVALSWLLLNVAKPRLTRPDLPLGAVTPPAPLSLNAAASTAVLAAGQSVPMVVYNPLGWQATRFAQVPVPVPSARVTTASGAIVPSYVTSNAAMTTICNSSDTVQCTAAQAGRGQYEEAPYTLHVQLDAMPPMGTTSLVVSPSSHAGSSSTTSSDADNDNVVIENQCYSLQFSRSTGKLSTVTVLPPANGGFAAQTVPVSHTMMQYHSYFNNTAGAASGSYVFHPLGPATGLEGAYATPRLEVVSSPTSSPLVQEVRQQWAPNAQVVWRLYGGPSAATAPGDGTFDGTACGGAGFIEVDFGVGPLAGNAEVISRWSTGLKTDAGQAGAPVVYTDNNGQQTQRRVLNSSASSLFPDEGYVIGSQYWPLVRRASIRDEAADLQFSVLSSRSHGASSLKSGELEVMLHRRELQDDNLGACYNHPHQNTHRRDGCPADKIPLNVTTRVYPRLWLVLGRTRGANPSSRALAQALNNPPVLAFGTPGADSTAASAWVQTNAPVALQGVTSPGLPIESHLLTLQPRSEASSQVVVRLQHTFEAGEVATTTGHTATPVELDLASLFNDCTLSGLSERSLSVVWDLQELQRQQWLSASSSASSSSAGQGGVPASTSPLSSVSSSVSLTPQQIRTFAATLDCSAQQPGHNPGRPSLTTILVVAGVALVVIVAGCVYFVWCVRRSSPRPPNASPARLGSDRSWARTVWGGWRTERSESLSLLQEEDADANTVYSEYSVATTGLLPTAGGSLHHSRAVSVQCGGASSVASASSSHPPTRRDSDLGSLGTPPHSLSVNLASAASSHESAAAGATTTSAALSQALAGTAAAAGTADGAHET